MTFLKKTENIDPDTTVKIINKIPIIDESDDSFPLFVKITINRTLNIPKNKPKYNFYRKTNFRIMCFINTWILFAKKK